MKIALIAPSSVPFTVGGAEKLWWGLQHHVNQLTEHSMELIKLPSPERNFDELMDSYARFAALDVSHFDRVITTKYPAWMVEHPDHHVYLQHTLRGLYDTYPLPEHACYSPFSPHAWPNALGASAIVALRHHPDMRALRRLLEARPERAQLPELFARVASLREGRWLSDKMRWGLLHFPGPLTRAIVHHLDRIALAPPAIRGYNAISRNVVARENYFPPGVPVQVVHHPSDLPVFEGRNHDYFFTVSRLDGPKRIELLLRGFMASRADCELRIAGTGPEEERLREIAAADPRVRFLGFLRDSEIVEQYRDALAVPFLPYDEDYGLITVEAMGAAKAVITCRDAGGVNEFVRHGETGWSVAPEPQALAAAFDEAAGDRERTIAMGRSARQAVRHVNWPDTVERLMHSGERATDDTPPFPVLRGRGGADWGPVPAADDSATTDAEGSATAERMGPPVDDDEDTSQGHWLVLNTYAVYPPMGGGQNRMYHLYRHLARAARVRITLLVLDEQTPTPRELRIAPGLYEHRIPLTSRQQARQLELTRALKASVADIAAIHGWQANEAYIGALKQHARTATLAICAHPYLVHALRAHYRGPWLYEAHNVEGDLKRDILGREAVAVGGSRAEEAIGWVDEAERLACREADRVVVCARGDLARFHELYGMDVDKGIEIPNCAALENLPFIDVATRRRWQKRLVQARPLALFLGSLHGPNLQAAHFICRRLAPRLPDVGFLLAGSLCDSPEFRHLPPNVRALGRVSDEALRVLLASVDAALNPMFAGSGSNLKMLDYTASGVPVLTTPFGNRGLDFPDEAVWLAEPDAFADTLRALLDAGDDERQARVARARELTERQFSWQAAVRPLVEAITQA
ncbi:glycosyltransferase [Modicisalibacter tunisiensis]|uniref:glycosyltransferase n=1 Tax=Modicisalibacter tunisiensis TaxID=390637 RepID=UPI001CCD524A|nr:glycosyltransferase [Modicisalibacter tunisiensis]MBZ9540437.1 glycosyltransferase [Modicisalibacter tunisiensis]